MAIEIERRFLVETDNWRNDFEYLGPDKVPTRTWRESWDDIVQAYFQSDTAIRIRIINRENAFITVKAPKSKAERFEFEYQIPLEDAQTMMTNIKMDIVVKKRFNMCKDVMWEIDEFHGKNYGLVIAEVELESADQEFEKPSWLGREITNDSRYSNKCLAMFPTVRDRRRNDPEHLKLIFEEGEVDASAGYPPKRDDPEYLKGYKVGYQRYIDTGKTTWDEPF